MSKHKERSAPSQTAGVDEKYPEETFSQEFSTEEEKDIKSAEKNQAATEPSNMVDAQKEHILTEKIKELEEENSSLKDQYLRKTADFENFRKRMFREKEEAIKYANTSLILDIITVIDDFERAIKSGQDLKDFDSFFTGIELIERQFVGLLERNWGLKRFDSLGKVFDPEMHEAIAKEETDSKDTIVLEDYQKGYMLQDRVIRHAKVKVSIPGQSNETKDNASHVVNKSEEYNG